MENHERPSRALFSFHTSDVTDFRISEQRLIMRTGRTLKL